MEILERLRCFYENADCDECMLDVRHAIEELERLYAERRWISVEERVPDEKCRVLVLWGRTGYVTMAWFRPDKKRKPFLYEVEGFNHSERSQAFITHWTPLPELPGVK